MGTVVTLDKAAEIVTKSSVDPQKVVEGFYEPSIFQYTADCEFATVSKEDMRSDEYIESLMIRGLIILSDMYIIEAVAFFGHADVQTVTSRLNYMKKKFPEKPIVSDFDGVQSRLHYLGTVGLLLRRKYHRPEGGNLHIYTITAKAFKVFTSRLDKRFNYNNTLIFNSTTKVLRNVHVAEVSCIMQSRLAKASVVEEWRQNSHCIKLADGKFYPACYLKCVRGETVYNFLYEAAHFNIDSTIETAEERIKSFEERIEGLAKCYDVYGNMYQNVAYVFCVEDIYGVKKLQKMLEPYKEIFSNRTYITSEKVLKQNGFDFAMSMLKPVIIRGKLSIVNIDTSKEWFM